MLTALIIGALIVWLINEIINHINGSHDLIDSLLSLPIIQTYVIGCATLAEYISKLHKD